MGDSFKLPHKQPSLEDLRAWRKGVITLNPARRFRYTADVNKRREAQDMIKVAFLATKALFVFLDKAFLLTANHLEGIQERPGHYKKLGGAEGIAAKLGVDSFDQGILGTEDDITKRIKIFGLNMYDEKPPKGFWLFIWEASQDLTLIVLVVCAVVSLAVGIPTEGLAQGWYDGVGILVSVFIVVFVTATSDYRQSLQFRNLKKEKKKIKVQVVRGGRKMTVFIQEIVVGDVVHLSTGDQIPADGIFLSGYSLTIDQSSLTGESEPVHPSKDEPFLLSGSMVVNGTGRMLVTAVGMRTEWGKLMSKLSEGGDNETPLQVRLNGVATTVGKIGLAFALLTFIVLLARFFVARFEEGFTWRMDYLSEIVNYFAIAVTILVVAVPEGLPLAVTLSLAYAMKQMIADKALVRNLSSCETMGSATCICSDKTGTLTSNQMTVVKVCCAGCVGMAESVASNLSERALKLLLGHIFVNTTGDIMETAGQLQVQGTPTEAAILEFGLLLRGDFHELRSDCEILQVEPFSSATKKMSVLVKLRNGAYRSYCKGASEIVLRMCKYRMDENGFSIPLDSVETQRLENVIGEFAKEALRTLCLAYADFDCLPQEDGEISAKGMTCLAIIGIKDPIRPGVKNAVNLCFKAGIQVRMVTGDNLETAKAIARECNILTNDGLAVEGPDFRQWSLTEMLEKVPKVQVIARSSPLDKLMLVQHLKDQQEVVAVTGDGTNDAPALHEADIGLAMGIAGTEVARSSADVIILDDNFTTIVNVAKWGRSVYTNIQKFVQFQLTVNVVALIINFVSACVTGDAPLTAVQLLWVNLIMDTLGALALATEAPYDALMERPPVGRKGTFITNVMWRNIFGQALYQLAVLWVLQFQGRDILNLTGDNAADELRTMIFNSFVFLQVFNEINSREMEKLNVFSNILTNKVFLGVLLSTVAFQIVIVEFLRRLANTVPLNALQWAVSVGIGFFSLFVAFLVKLIPVPTKPLSELFSREVNKDGYTALP